MPVDLNKRYSVPRCYSRSRDLELKRAKGEASCAECRRLKLKCDKQVPCTSCVRRGCQMICPNGTLTAGQGSRFVLANTDKLHEKLSVMSKRIRQLEDALQVTQAAVSPTRHPLLSEELLEIKSGAGIFSEKAGPDIGSDDLTGDLVCDLGTLSISERGEACFMGRGSSEALLEVMGGTATEQEKQSNGSSQPLDVRSLQMLLTGESFPFSLEYRPETRVLEAIEARLPDYARATALAEAYLANVAWSSMLVDREQIFEELLPIVYKRSSDNQDPDEDESNYAHHLALLLCVFASGASGDLTLPIGNDEAELYNHLARATLCLKSVFSGATMESVQAVSLMAMYDFSASRRYSLEPSWKMMYLGLSLASSIGLQRDPARWNLEPKVTQRRRRLFWEIFTLDKWRSLETGRPAMFNLREIDCEFPEDKQATLDEQGQKVPGYWHWKFRYVKEVLAPIAEQLCQTKPSKYSEILDLDRKVREFASPSFLREQECSPCENPTDDLRRYHWLVLREASLLFTHRSFFARALLDNPTRPLGSPFASSLLSAYASSMTMLQIMRVYFQNYPQIVLRQWMIWAHGVTSSVIVGCVSCRGPASPVASAALKELEHAVELFKAAQLHPVPRRALPFLVQLLGKARDANQPVPKKVESPHQELSILGGAPIFLNKASKRGSLSNSNQSTPPSSPVPSDAHGRQPGVMMQPPSFAEFQRASSAFPRLYQNDSSQAIHDRNRAILPPVNMSCTIPTEAVWLEHHSAFRDTVSIAPVSSSLGPGAFAGWNQASRDLSSTSWLEQLSNDIPVGFGQDDFTGNNEANLDFLLGGVQPVSMNAPREDQGEDPVIAEAWRSLLAGE